MRARTVRQGMFVFLCLAAGCSSLSPSGRVAAARLEERNSPTPGPTPTSGWRLVWQDEFDGPSGRSVDPKRWTFDEGGEGWGNEELEYYTRRTENAALDGQGHLIITARREDFKARSYTSARLKTQGLAAFVYGRVEARARVPEGQGLWPAFWMLGEDITSVGWPRCGEIDIMENIGREPNTLHGTIHGPGYSGGSGPTSVIDLATPLAADFHTYALEWEARAIRWYVDGKQYGMKTPADLPPGAAWVFDHPFFLLLNVAVGGKWPGNPVSTTTFPQTLAVDYVKVYQR